MKILLYAHTGKSLKHLICWQFYLLKNLFWFSVMLCLTTNKEVTLYANNVPTGGIRGDVIETHIIGMFQ